jgi:hypothetical protein
MSALMPLPPSSTPEDINLLDLDSTPADGKPPSDDVNSIAISAINATMPENINLVNLDSTPADGKPPNKDNIFRHHRNHHNLEDMSILPTLPPLPNINDHNYEIGSSSANEPNSQNFNKQVFTLNSITLTFENDPGCTSMTLTPARWNEIVHTLLNWGPRDEEGRYIPLGSIEEDEEKSRLRLYRQLHKHGYEWAKVYKVEAFQDCSTGEVSGQPLPPKNILRHHRLPETLSHR